jgi:UTP--glucose-1-phosphate uridylyltransferase
MARNKRAMEDYFNANFELEVAQFCNGKHAKVNIVHNILPSGVDCIYVR